MGNSEITFRLKSDLKLKRRPTALNIIEYAKIIGVKYTLNGGNGTTTYNWTESQYQELLEIYET